MFATMESPRLRTFDAENGQETTNSTYAADYTSIPQELLHTILEVLLEGPYGVDALRSVRLTCSAWRTALQYMPNLSLSPASLSPSTVGLFPGLSALDLVSRHGSHRLDPTSLHSLHKLRLLKSLRFSGAFSDWVSLAAKEVARCSLLTSLRIENCKMEGRADHAMPFLESVGSMHGLRDLAIADLGFIQTPVIASLVGCTALRSLDLQGCHSLSTEDVRQIAAHFQQLQHLNLSRCDGIDVGPLGCLRFIRDIRLAGCIGVSDEGLTVFVRGTGSTLRSLHLSGCQRLTSQGLNCLVSATGLQVLDLSHLSRSFSNSAMPWLDQLRSLQTLYLNESHMTRTAMHSLCAAHAALTSLSCLSLARLVNTSCVEDMWVMRLTNFQSLRALDLTGGHHLNDSALTHLLTRVTALESLNLSRCKRISDASMGACLGGLRHIRFLNLSGTCVSDAGLMLLAAQSTLEELRLNSCSGVGDGSMPVIAEHIRLRHLELDGTGISNEGLLRLAPLTGLTSLSLQRCTFSGEGLLALRDMSRLKSLKLGVCWSLTACGLTHVAACKRLSLLDLNSCAKAVTNQSLGILAPSLLNLASINISNCSQVTNSGLAALRRMPALVRVDLTCCAQLAELAIQRQLGPSGSEISFPAGNVSPCASPSRKHLAALHRMHAGSLMPMQLLA